MKENDRLLKAKEVCEKIGVSESTLRRMVKEGDFPAPIRISKRASRWRLSEVEEWMDTRPPATDDNWQ